VEQVDMEEQVLMSYKVMSWLNTFLYKSWVVHYYQEDNIRKNNCSVNSTSWFKQYVFICLFKNSLYANLWDKVVPVHNSASH